MASTWTQWTLCWLALSSPEALLQMAFTRTVKPALEAVKAKGGRGGKKGGCGLSCLCGLIMFLLKTAVVLSIIACFVF